MHQKLTDTHATATKEPPTNTAPEDNSFDEDEAVKVKTYDEDKTKKRKHCEDPDPLKPHCFMAIADFADTYAMTPQLTHHLISAHLSTKPNSPPMMSKIGTFPTSLIPPVVERWI